MSQLKVTLDLGTVMLNAPVEVPEWFRPICPEPSGKSQVDAMLDFHGPEHLKSVADAMRRRCTHYQGRKAYDAPTTVERDRTATNAVVTKFGEEDLVSLQEYEKQLDYYLENINKKPASDAALKFCRGIAWKVYYAGKVLELIRKGKFGIKSTDVDGVIDLES